jgi:hypothetical protein
VSNQENDNPDTEGDMRPSYPLCWGRTLAILREHGRQLDPLGRDHLADGAHVVAVDPTTHRSYYPIPQGPDGHPALLSYDPTS